MSLKTRNTANFRFLGKHFAFEVGPNSVRPGTIAAGPYRRRLWLQPCALHCKLTNSCLFGKHFCVHVESGRSREETPHPHRTSAPSPLVEGSCLTALSEGRVCPDASGRVRGSFVRPRRFGCGPAVLRYLYAGIPVTRSPMIRVWILCVPS